MACWKDGSTAVVEEVACCCCPNTSSTAAIRSPTSAIHAKGLAMAALDRHDARVEVAAPATLRTGLLETDGEDESRVEKA